MTVFAAAASASSLPDASPSDEHRRRRGAPPGRAARSYGEEQEDILFITRVEDGVEENPDGSSTFTLMTSVSSMTRGERHDRHDELQEEGRRLQRDVWRRRDVAASLLCMIAASPLFLGVDDAPAVPPPGGQGPFGAIGDDVVKSLVYERLLGSGSYKTVYLVSSPKETGGMRFALAVERLRGAGNAREAFRGIEVADELERVIAAAGDGGVVGADDAGAGKVRRGPMFERVEGWWLQPGGIKEFEEGAKVFGPLEGRSRSLPGRFLGAKFLVALKPVYDMDLKRFSQSAPLSWTVGAGGGGGPGQAVVAGIDTSNEGTAIGLALDLCRAGRVMHEKRFIHRDIKPKNCMLVGGRAIIIDFGFAQRADGWEGWGGGKGGRVCVGQGQVRGEVRYVLARDVGKLRGCQEGDCYAMGKTVHPPLLPFLSFAVQFSSPIQCSYLFPLLPSPAPLVPHMGENQ